MVKSASTDFLLPLWQRLGFDSKEQFEMSSNFINTTYAQWYKNDELANKIEYLTGYTLEDLLEKFAAGWTSQPQEPDKFSMLRYEED